MFIPCISAFGISLAIVLITMPLLIRFLHKINYNQAVSEYSLQQYKEKQKTPTMGGILFVLTPVAVTLLMYPGTLGDLQVMIVMLAYVGYGLIGFLDDYIIVIRQDNEGLRPRTKFLLPDALKRRRSLMFAALGVVLIAGGALIAVFWQEMMLVGAILSVFGIFLAVRSIIGFAKAKGMLAFYDEGIYWRESGRPEADRFFLKWSEAERVKVETIEEKRYIAVVCAYGSYHIPEVAGAYEFLSEFRPGLCE